MATNLKAKYANIILRPRITEKSSYLAESNVYAFEVGTEATKSQVVEAVRAFYDVIPTKVNIVKNPVKKVIVKGKRGTKAGVKKAYVFLKEGDKIE